MKTKLFLLTALLATSFSAKTKEEKKEPCQIGYPMATVNTIADVLTGYGAQEKLKVFRQYVSMTDSVTFSEKRDWHKNPVSSVTLSGNATVEGDIACGRLSLTVTRSFERTKGDPLFPGYWVYNFKAKTSELLDYCRDQVKKSLAL
jgi:hypothetical protein